MVYRIQFCFIPRSGQKKEQSVPFVSKYLKIRSLNRCLLEDHSFHSFISTGKSQKQHQVSVIIPFKLDCSHHVQNLLVRYSALLKRFKVHPAPVNYTEMVKCKKYLTETPQVLL